MDTEEWVTHRGPAHLSSPSSLTGRPILASFWSSSGTWDLAFIYSAPYSDPMWCIQEWTQGVTDYSFSPYFR